MRASSFIAIRTLVHIEADFKKRTIKDDAGNFSDQTLNLLSAYSCAIVRSWCRC